MQNRLVPLCSTSIPHETALFEHMQTAVVVTNAHLHIVLVNSAAELLLSASKSQLLGSNLSTFFADDTNLPALGLKALNNQQAFSLADVPLILKAEVLHSQAANQKQAVSQKKVTSQKQTTNPQKAPHHAATEWLDISVTPLEAEPSSLHQDHSTLKNNKAAQSKLLFELRSKSRQAQIAHEAQQQQQLLVARQLIRGMAHEIKNPLASIRGAAQLMQQTTSDMLPKHTPANALAQELQDYTSLMIKEADRLKNLTDAMLGSPQLPHKKWLNIHQPLEHVIHLVKSQFSHIALKKDYDASLPNVLFDHDKLIQVFLNISLNAAQALTDMQQSPAKAVKNETLPKSFKPHIIFKTRICSNKVLQGTNHKQVVQISIIDNAAGIPTHIQKTLFYPLVTTKAQGTGLGLSIAQEIIRQHGGMIDFYSHTGHTAFYVFLPLAIHEQTHTP